LPIGNDLTGENIEPMTAAHLPRTALGIIAVLFAAQPAAAQLVA
jgi:hypothetical protein